MINIVHHHTFKCAGTTFAKILHQNFPTQVLHIEGIKPDARINGRDVLLWLNNQENVYQAVSSHLLTLPQVNEEWGNLHISLLRDPLHRQISDYYFSRKRENNNEKFNNISLTENMKISIQEGNIKNNFQVKHSSYQDYKENNKQGWNVNLESLHVDRENIFFGIVELFDESMVVLENIMENKGLKFDASYPHRANTSEYEKNIIETIDLKLLNEFISANSLDYAWYEVAKSHLLNQYKALDPDGKKIKSFKQRCKQLKQKQLKPIILPKPSEWIRVERRETIL